MAGDITELQLLKVAELIGTDWQGLGTHLGIPWVEINSLATPSTGGPSEYAQRMLNAWYLKNKKAYPTAAHVTEALVRALKETQRKDVADEVQKTLISDNDIERVFQSISAKLIRDWDKVGIYLGIPVEDRDAVKANPGLEENPRQRVLQMWHKDTPAQDRRKKLINAVGKLQRQDIIMAIEKLDIGTREEDPIQGNSLFTQKSQTAQTGANAENTLCEQSAGQSEDQHDANGPPDHGTVKEGEKLDIGTRQENPIQGNSLFTQESQTPQTGHQQAEGQAKCKNPRVPPGDPAPDPPSTVLDINTHPSLPAKKDVTTSDSPHASAKLNPGYEWMGLKLKDLRDAVTIDISRPVVVALLDSGINQSHPDLKNYIIKSENFIPSDGERQDLIKDAFNHGTMSAGILWQYAGTKNVKLLNLKVLTSENKGSLSYVASALQYIKQWDVENPTMPVDIVVMSLGERVPHNETDDLLNELGKKVLICSAGNEGERQDDALLSPAKHGGVIAVGSCAEFGNRDDHSAVGPKLTFLFPGKDIKSTSSHYTPSDENTRYYTKSGTSFAAPSCAALVAVLLLFIEQKLNNFCGESGGHWRTELTRCSRMEELISDFCPGTYNVNKGYGVPNFKLITEYRIKDFIKRTFKT